MWNIFSLSVTLIAYMAYDYILHLHLPTLHLLIDLVENHILPIIINGCNRK